MVLCKEGVFRNFAKFTGKHLRQSLFLNKVAGLRPATLLKKRIWGRCFPVNFLKFLWTSFHIEHLWWLLQTLVKTNLILVKIHLTTNVSYHDMAIFWKNFISVEGKITLKGFWNNTNYRYKRNSLLLEAATGVVLYNKRSLKTSRYSQESACVRVSFLIKLQA